MHFTANGVNLGYTFLDFCDWAACSRRNEPVLQMLMEYIVGKALDCVKTTYKTPENLECCYQTMRDGRKLAVLTGSYVRSIYQEHPDWIGFNADTSIKGPDIFVFCVNRSMSAFSIPTNLDVWDFYVIRGSDLERLGSAEVATLPGLLSLQPIKCSFAGIWQAVHSV